MPSYRAGFVIEECPISEEHYRVLRDWAKAHDRTVPQLLASLARDAAHAITGAGGPETAGDNLAAVDVPEPPKPSSMPTNPAHIELVEKLQALGITEMPVLPKGWHKRRVSDFTAVVRELFARGWNDVALAELLGFTPSGMLEERRRLGLFRTPNFERDVLAAALDAWNADPRREVLARYGLEFPPLRPGADRLACRDFRPAIGVLAVEYHLNDREIGTLIGYGAAAVSLERRALKVPGQTSRRGAVLADAS